MPNIGAAGQPTDSHKTQFTIPGVETTTPGPQIGEDLVFDYLEGTPVTVVHQQISDPVLGKDFSGSVGGIPGGLRLGGPQDQISDGLTSRGTACFFQILLIRRYIAENSAYADLFR